MIHSSSSQSGFTAVELLISLFIAVAFIATGYQLYSIIINDGGAARARTRASNVAYTALQKYSAQTTSPCSVVTPTPTPTIPSDSGLTNASITVSISCPYGAGTSSTSKVEVSVKYNSPQEEVVHALYKSQ